GQVKGIGQHTLRRLVDHYGDLRKIWSEDPPILADVLGRARVRDYRTVATTIISRADDLRARGERQRDVLAQKGVSLLSMHDAKFPARLLGIPDPPYWLFVQGNPDVLCEPPMVAIVGTREASSVGSKTAER